MENFQTPDSNISFSILSSTNKEDLFNQTTMSEKYNSHFVLPKEIIQMILEHMTPSALRVALFLNKQWNEITKTYIEGQLKKVELSWRCIDSMVIKRMKLDWEKKKFDLQEGLLYLENKIERELPLSFQKMILYPFLFTQTMEDIIKMKFFTLPESFSLWSSNVQKQGNQPFSEFWNGFELHEVFPFAEDLNQDIIFGVCLNSMFLWNKCKGNSKDSSSNYICLNYGSVITLHANGVLELIDTNFANWFENMIYNLENQYGKLEERNILDW